MSSQLITNIGELYGVHNPAAPLRGAELANLHSIRNAYVIIESDRIVDFGEMSSFGYKSSDFSSHYDADGGSMFPSWCDSHTHLVFAGSREQEFVDKIKGLSYAEIAARGGGILSTARKVREETEEELFRLANDRLNEIAKLGTGAIEIKSGYGLTVGTELKMLRVIKRLKEKSPLLIRSSFLGAHSYPPEFRENHEAYLQQLIDEMLPQVAVDSLADYIDVFCETGFFSKEETIRILSVAAGYGLRGKIHANQLNSMGAVQAAIDCKALSADHLETMTDGDISDLAKSDVIGTMLPTPAFFLRMQYQPARKLIESGAAVALASDFNPGSSPSGNMNLVFAIACIQLRMLPEEALNAATINGAFAMGLEKEVGSIAIGKRANLILTKKIPSLAYLAYAFGSNHIQKVMLNGRWLEE